MEIETVTATVIKASEGRLSDAYQTEKYLVMKSALDTPIASMVES